VQDLSQTTAHLLLLCAVMADCACAAGSVGEVPDWGPVRELSAKFGGVNTPSVPRRVQSTSLLDRYPAPATLAESTMRRGAVKSEPGA
jgi:hypothetical protein